MKYARIVMIGIFLFCAVCAGGTKIVWSQEDQKRVVAETPEDVRDWLLSKPQEDDSSGRDKSARAKASHIDDDILIIQMNYNSSDFDSASRPKLEELGETLRILPDLVLEVAGHTDARGDDKYNLWLSYQRANEIKRFLTTQYQIPAKQLIITAHGEYQLRDSGNTKAAHAKNRRVELRKINSGR